MQSLFFFFSKQPVYYSLASFNFNLLHLVIKKNTPAGQIQGLVLFGSKQINFKK